MKKEKIKSSLVTKSWIRGYNILLKIDPSYTQRELRIGAMMYEKGYTNGRKSRILKGV